MAMNTQFNDMLNEVLAYDLLEEEYKKQCWLLENANWKKDFDGSKIIIPFTTASPSSVRMGGLVGKTKINQGKFARGSLDQIHEAYGALLFWEKELKLHGKISKANFMRLLPDQLEELMRFMKQCVSISVLNAGELLQATGAGDAQGVVKVSNTERVQLNQALTIVGNSATVLGYVDEIDKNTDELKFRTTLDGNTALNLSAAGAEVVAGSKIYLENGDAENFTSLLDQLLPAGVNGASATIFGFTKKASPFTQAVAIDGSGATGATLLATIFDALVRGRQKGATPKVFLGSYKHLGAILKATENIAGAFRHQGERIDYAGYSVVEIGDVTGNKVKFVAIREHTDTAIQGIDPKYLDFHTAPASMFEVIESPDGLKYYTERDDADGSNKGYSYITDIRFAGEFVYTKPHTAVVIYDLDI